MKESDKMFSFFHRTPKIHLDCYTTQPHVYQFTPIVKSSKTIPDWWKELPNEEFTLGKDDQGILTNQSRLNLKNCYGFLEYFQNSICVRHWADLFVETSEEGYNYYCSTGDKPIEHNRQQIGKGFEDYHHMKLSSPWIFKEKTGIKFINLGAEWNLDKFSFRVLPGVMEFRVNSFTNVNIMLPKEQNKFIIPVNQPLTNFLPLTEKKLVVKNHLITEEEYKKMSYNPSLVYFHGWRACKNMIKDNDKKCPFGFGE
jgi:hypothetical protein